MTVRRCMSWLGRDGDGNAVLIDPHEGEPIGAHYALSHFAAAAVVGWGAGSEVFEAGVSVLRGVLARWQTDSSLSGFHNDFNNFALCIAEGELGRRGLFPDDGARIRDTVLGTPDSNHDTVNWLPMRMYVDARRNSWGDRRPGLERCRRLIARACDADGFIEDRLPRGVSFNLQYDVATVGALQFLEDAGVEQPADLGRAFAALSAATMPDGDINYLGRGCNQIFAWGPWVYLLAARGDDGQIDRALNFLDRRVPTMLENENILLNDLPGRDRQLWWDYHYCSVYTAHFLLWLVLARRRIAERLPRAVDVARSIPSSYGGDSGVTILRSEDAFVTTFSGRREYLAERGPVLAGLWTREHGTIHKGAFGPWLKAFGYLHSSPMTLLNHFGVLGAGGLKPGLAPLFMPIEAHAGRDCIELVYSGRRPRLSCFNVPLADGGVSGSLGVYADGRRVGLRPAGGVVTQYGREVLFQTEPVVAKQWKVVIDL